MIKNENNRDPVGRVPSHGADTPAVGRVPSRGADTSDAPNAAVGDLERREDRPVRAPGLQSAPDVASPCPQQMM
jgi:hypothetical protein